MASLESGVELIAEIGMEPLVAKSRAMSEFFLECLADTKALSPSGERVGSGGGAEDLAAGPTPQPPPLKGRGSGLTLVSPHDPVQRGSQLSFRHDNAYALSQALIARGVIGDFRDPDILRLGFAPAYLRFEDIANAARHLAEVLETGEWQRDEFATRAAVT